MKDQLIFSKREFERRFSRARELMKAAGIDSLFLTGDENFHYFTGGAGMTHMRSNARANIVIVPADGEAIAITGSGLTYVVKLAGAVKDIRPYSSVFGVPNDLLVRALKDAGLRNRKVGVEMGLEQRLNMPLGDYLELTKSLPDLHFVDASSILWELRMIKSEEEVKLMKKACQITGRARQKTFKELEIGMTEQQIARTFARHMIEEGGNRVSFIHVAAGIPANHTYIYLDRRLKKGDVLYLDGGAYAQTYTCDYARLAVAGKPSSRQVLVHKAIRKANRLMMEALKPGLTCADIFEVGTKALRDEGMVGILSEVAGRMGHGQGILITEPPSIAAGDKTVLKPGLVISTEPGVETANGQFTWEDIHVITEDGAEQLTTEREDFFSIR